MRFTALLLLAALAGALVCAQDATAGLAQPTEDPASLQSDAPQETTIAAQTSAAAKPSNKEKRKNLKESIFEKKGKKIEAFIEKADKQWLLIHEIIKDNLKSLLGRK